MTDTELRGYIPIPIPMTPLLAVRTGVRWSFGAYPIHDAATVGGEATLRGYRWRRFAGDAAAWGGAELRVPVTRANLLLARGQLGVLGLVDVGRVWFEGASPGGWHTGVGAGLFFRTLDTAIHVAWAHGEENRLYAGVGLPF
jgi:hemolysin activation/secretion protein